MVTFPKQFAQFEELLQVGQVLLAQGRLDIQEEKEPKLLGERIELVPKEVPRSPQERTESAYKNADTPTAAEKTTDSARSARAGLYLRLPTDHGELMDLTTQMLAQNAGDFPVYIRFADSGKLVRAPQNWWISSNEKLLDDLRRLLGADNVAVIH
jgi:DNA polymerase-3 subunit alpha